MVNKITKDKILITSRQILLTFLDLALAYHDYFDTKGYYRIPMNRYRQWRENDRLKFSQKLYELKRAGFVKRYFDGKKEFLEITKKGKERIKRIITQELTIETPNKWDRKWRMVIFDIPDRKKPERDIIRDKLEQLGFHQLQESVYVYPFNCREQIERIKQMYFLEPYILYIEADRIETEVNLIGTFYKEGILTDKLLK